MRLWNHYAPAKEWTKWVARTSTEDRLSQVIRRKHREQYQHQRCPYPDCDIHAEPLTELPVLASDNHR